MKVLDLFSGLGGFSQAFKDKGHEVTTYDINPRFTPDILIDINNVVGLPPCDVILASPPCEKFSVASIGRYWPNHTITPEAQSAIDLVEHTLHLIYQSRPTFWFLENPMGMLRTIIGNPPVQIYFAQYGENRLKPTDIWGRHPKGFKDMQIRDRSLLEYEHAPRGSKLGTQSIKDPAERARIPYQLSLTICKLCEQHIK